MAAPPDVIGMFTDFLQRTITDVGLIGPNRARGGLYLLLPPGYEGEGPRGYLRSSTYNVFLFFRTIMKKGTKRACHMGRHPLGTARRGDRRTR